MNYYTVEASELLDGTFAQTINLYQNDEASTAYDKAMARYHEFMHYQMVAGTVKKAFCLVVSEQTVVVHSEVWEKHTTSEIT